MSEPLVKRYVQFLHLLLLLVFLLVFLGSWVRHTGSGMGCPDWPRCYGQWLPPTHAQQLPKDYQPKSRQKRLQRNQQLIQTLNRLRLNSTAQSLHNYLQNQKEEAFNPTKAWTEYLNRLLGVIVGIMYVLNLWWAFRLKHAYPPLIKYALWSLVCVMTQGLLGAVVVLTHLFPLMITLHMLLALGLLMGWNNLKHTMTTIPTETKTRLNPLDEHLIKLSFLLLLVQILLGTQVRQQVDSWGTNFSTWPATLPSFYVHRSLPWILLAMIGFFTYRIHKSNVHASLRREATKIFVGLLIATGLGGLIYLFHAPFLAQPLHLTTGLFIFHSYLPLLKSCTFIKTRSF